MENPIHFTAPPQSDHPVLLALPGVRTDRRSEVCEPCPEKLYLLATRDGPSIETATLRELLTRTPELEKYLADPVEVQNNRHPLAAVNAYKHRLHALRCENANLRTRVRELEIQMNRMCATRGWQLLEKYRRWRRTVFGLFRK